MNTPYFRIKYKNKPTVEICDKVINSITTACEEIGFMGIEDYPGNYHPKIIKFESDNIAKLETGDWGLIDEDRKLMFFFNNIPIEFEVILAKILLDASMHTYNEKENI